uniref:Uncharacterized protein n=1 Tax=Panagrolaimus davidi TaxID=227884 RepID=A0A914Q247_9BILA
MSAENDEEKWIEALAETNDNEFVEHVVEFKLGGDLTNKKLWHVYINYLKSRISKAKIDYWMEQYTKVSNPLKRHFIEFQAKAKMEKQGKKVTF